MPKNGHNRTFKFVTGLCLPVFDNCGDADANGDAEVVYVLHVHFTSFHKIQRRFSVNLPSVIFYQSQSRICGMLTVSQEKIRNFQGYVCTAQVMLSHIGNYVADVMRLKFRDCASISHLKLCGYYFGLF